MQERSIDGKFDVVRPRAAALVESLRGVGYSVPTAIADLIDNSISAGARNIWLTFWWAGRESWVSLLDDGSGMDERQLVDAMRAGSRSPLEHRDGADLGRFGLGLKTAAFSMGRRLTVSSRAPGAETAVRRWDLDAVCQHDDWVLAHGAAEGSTGRCVVPQELSSGTVVLLESLDRVIGTADSSEKSQDAFLTMTEQVERHLAMVFHQFIEGPAPALRLYLNGRDERHRVRAWDPFMSWHPATWRTPPEPISGPSGPVEMQGFVLPHRDRLQDREFEDGGGPTGWAGQQGFYVYRNGRMLVPGDWLGLGRGRAWTKDEAHRLARVRLQFTNAADAEWNIDIRKSQAHPPLWLRGRLSDLGELVRARARSVFVHRGAYGNRPADPKLQRVWKSVGSGAALRYRIDRDHPVIRAAVERATHVPELEHALRVVEDTVPVQRIWLNALESEGIDDRNSVAGDTREIASIARGMLKYLVEAVRLDRASAIERLGHTEPFQHHPELLDQLAKEAEAS